jgi:hypothetical protein
VHNAQPRVRLSTSEAKTLAEQALSKISYDSDEARIIANYVVDAGGYEYSGLRKILELAEHRQLRQPRPPMSALRETSLSGVRFR